MLYPQHGDRIVAIDYVTSLHPVYWSISPPAGRSAANPPAAIAAVDRWDRQTDRQTDGRTDTGS